MKLDWPTESGSGYTFFWKGKAVYEKRIHGVGFAIKSYLLKQIPSFPTGEKGLGSFASLSATNAS